MSYQNFTMLKFPLLRAQDKEGVDFCLRVTCCNMLDCFNLKLDTSLRYRIMFTSQNRAYFACRKAVYNYVDNCRR